MQGNCTLYRQQKQISKRSKTSLSSISKILWRYSYIYGRVIPVAWIFSFQLFNDDTCRSWFDLLLKYKDQHLILKSLNIYRRKLSRTLSLELIIYILIMLFIRALNQPVYLFEINFTWHCQKNIFKKPGLV